MSRRDSTIKDLREGSKLSMGHGKDRRLSIVSNAGGVKGENLLVYGVKLFLSCVLILKVVALIIFSFRTKPEWYC